MNWLCAALLTFVALLPCIYTLIRRDRGAPSSRDMALSFYRAQLAELQHESTNGAIAPDQHDLARVEIQRRALAAAQLPEEEAGTQMPASRYGVCLLLVGVGAFALYLVGGSPFLPAQPLAPRLARHAQEQKKNEALIDKLRQTLNTLDDSNPAKRRGYILLGDACYQSSRLTQAVEAWRKALALQFDAVLAVKIAEVQAEKDGFISDQSAALLRAALKQGPREAPWRPLAEQRLAQFNHQGQ